MCLRVLEDANKLREVAHLNNQVQDPVQHERTLTSENGSSEVDLNRRETDHFSFPIYRNSHQTANQPLTPNYQSPIYVYRDQNPWFSPIVPYMGSPATTIYYPQPLAQSQQERFASDPIYIPCDISNISQRQHRQPTPNRNSSTQDRQMNDKGETWICNSDLESKYEAIEGENGVNLDSEESEYYKYPGSSFINGTVEDEKVEPQELSYVDLASEEYEKCEHPGSSYIDIDTEDTDSIQDDEAEQASGSVDSVELPRYQSFRSNIPLRRTSSYVYQDSDEAGTEYESDQEIVFLIAFKTD